MESSIYIDINQALDRLRGNNTLFVKMLKLFLASEDFGNLDRAYKSDNLAVAADLAHAIKGVTGNLALTKLFDESNALMVKLKNNEKDDELFSALMDSYDKTVLCVNNIIEDLSVK